MITVNFYQNKSANNVVNKDIISTINFNCVLKDDVDIIKPSLILELDNTGLNAIKISNYCYIADFNRYYYITNIIFMRNNIFKVDLSCDVLMSFKNEIKECTGIIKRQSNDYNLYLNDGSLKVYQNPHIVTKEFPQGFTGNSYLLAVAGA